MNEETTSLGREASALFEQYLTKIERCVGLLDGDQLWWRANPRCNSVGNLLLHLVGNLSQWVLAGLGGEAYERRRGVEFAADRSATREGLLDRLRQVVGRCRELSGRLTPGDLTRRYAIQGYERDGFGVLLHAVEHTSYHTGQIVHVTKELVGDRVDIEFHPHLKDQ